MNNNLITKLLEVLELNHQHKTACLKLVSDEVIREESPSTSERKRVMNLDAKDGGFNINYLDSQSIDNLWRYVFIALVPEVLADLEKNPIGERQMKRIFKKYEKYAGGPLNVPVFLEFLMERVVALRTYSACEELVCKQMLEDIKPDWLKIKGILSAMPEYGTVIDALPSDEVHALWDCIFNRLAPHVISNLYLNRSAHPDRLNELREKYKNGLPKKEEPYDNVVEDLYLTAVNDREIYRKCMQEVQKLLHIRKTRLPTGRVRYLLSYKNGATGVQLVKAWFKIFNHLLEPTIYEMEENNLCHAGELEAIKQKYAPHLAKSGTVTHRNVVEQKLSEIKMSNQYVDTPMKTVTYVYGQDIESLTAEELLKLIERTSQEKKELKATDIISTYVDKQVLSLVAAGNAMIEKLDSL